MRRRQAGACQDERGEKRPKASSWGGSGSAPACSGGFECIGYCEIDKYAKQAYEAIYDTKGELYYDDARNIDPNSLPDIDLICGGFPCQSFSIAGKRGGFNDARGTLFFEIARIAAVKRPMFLCLENVPGLLSHDSGRTFAAILSSLDELGYDVAWQVLNSAHFGVPQSRNRVYIIGYLREKCSGKILAFTKANGTPIVQVIPGHEGERVYSEEGIAVTLTAQAGGFGGKSGLYQVGIPIKSKTKLGYQIASPGDSIDIAYPNKNSRRGRVGSKVAHTLTTDSTQSMFFVDMNDNTTITDNARCITARQDSGISNHRGEHSAVLVCESSSENKPKAIISPTKEKIGQAKEPGKSIFTITVQDKNGMWHRGRVRKLTPLECWRLQGFTDEQFYKAKMTGLSDGRLYAMAGNAVTVPVISALGQVIKSVYAENTKKE